MEMISPAQYKEMNKDKSLDELLLLKEQLQSEIVTLSQNDSENSLFTSDTRLQMKEAYFDEIWKLIKEKRENQNISIDKDELQSDYMVEKIFDKNSFFIEIKSGAVLPLDHKDYYAGRIDILLSEQFKKIEYSVKIEKSDYSLSNEQFSKVKQMISDNLNSLIDIAKNQNEEMYAGTYDSMLIKVKSILLNISLDNVNNEKDFMFLNNLKKDIINILTGITNNAYNFYKNNVTDIIWWVDNKDRVGEHLFTFDRKIIFNLFKDYPYKLTKEEKEIFDRENPYWADFFKDRIVKNEDN